MNKIKEEKNIIQDYTYQKYYPKINIFLLMKRIKIKTKKKMEKTHGHSESTVPISVSIVYFPLFLEFC